MHAPGEDRADLSTMTAVHVVRGEIVAPFVKTRSLSRWTGKIHIQASRFNAPAVRADISAPAAVFLIIGQIAARSITESQPPLTTLPVNARLS
jgi:hypothetical protein